ncbi:MAG: alpha-L-fucosidase [Planctomycetota bacterium]
MDWEQLKNHKVPEWFKDAKFGIYAHWGAYCVGKRCTRASC